MTYKEVTKWYNHIAWRYKLRTIKASRSGRPSLSNDWYVYIEKHGKQAWV